MTTPEAKTVHDHITAARGWIMWFVTNNSPGRFVVRAIVADRWEGHQEGDDLVADTLGDLRAMLPAGLTRWDRMMMIAAFDKKLKAVVGPKDETKLPKPA